MLSRLLTPELAPLLLSYCTSADIRAILATSFRNSTSLARWGVVVSLAFAPSAPPSTAALEMLLGIERDGNALRWRPGGPTPPWLAELHRFLSDSPSAGALSLSPSTLIQNEIAVGRLPPSAARGNDRLLACVETLIRLADGSVLPVSEFPGLAQVYRPAPHSGPSIVTLVHALLPLYASSSDVLLVALALHKRVSEFIPYDAHGNWVPRTVAPARSRRAPVSFPSLLLTSGLTGDASPPWKLFRPHFRLVVDAATKLMARTWPALHKHLASLAVDVRALLSGWLGNVVGAASLPFGATCHILTHVAAEGWAGLVWVCLCALHGLQSCLFRCASARAVEVCCVDDLPAVLSDPATFTAPCRLLPLWRLDVSDALSAVCGLPPPARVSSPPLHPITVRAWYRLPALATVATPDKPLAVWSPAASLPDSIASSPVVGAPKQAVSDATRLGKDFGDILSLLPNADGSVSAPAVESQTLSSLLSQKRPPSPPLWADDVSVMIGGEVSGQEAPVARGDEVAAGVGGLRFSHKRGTVEERKAAHKFTPPHRIPGTLTSAQTTHALWYSVEDASPSEAKRQGTMGRLLSETVSRFPHLQRLAKDVGGELSVTSEAAAPQDKSGIFRKFVEDKIWDDGPGASFNAPDAKPVSASLADLTFSPDPGFNWEYPRFRFAEGDGEEDVPAKDADVPLVAGGEVVPSVAKFVPDAPSSVPWGQRALHRHTAKAACKFAGVDGGDATVVTVGADAGDVPAAQDSPRLKAVAEFLKRGFNSKRETAPQSPPPPPPSLPPPPPQFALPAPVALSPPPTMQSLRPAGAGAVSEAVTVVGGSSGSVAAGADGEGEQDSVSRSRRLTVHSTVVEVRKPAVREASPSAPDSENDFDESEPSPSPAQSDAAAPEAVAQNDVAPTASPPPPPKLMVKLPASFQSVLRDSGILTGDAESLELDGGEQPQQRDVSKAGEWLRVERLLSQPEARSSVPGAPAAAAEVPTSEPSALPASPSTPAAAPKRAAPKKPALPSTAPSATSPPVVMSSPPASAHAVTEPQKAPVRAPPRRPDHAPPPFSSPQPLHVVPPSFPAIPMANTQPPPPSRVPVPLPSSQVPSAPAVPPSPKQTRAPSVPSLPAPSVVSPVVARPPAPFAATSASLPSPGTARGSVDVAVSQSAPPAKQGAAPPPPPAVPVSPSPAPPALPRSPSKASPPPAGVAFALAPHLSAAPLIRQAVMNVVEPLEEDEPIPSPQSARVSPPKPPAPLPSGATVLELLAARAEGVGAAVEFPSEIEVPKAPTMSELLGRVKGVRRQARPREPDVVLSSATHPHLHWPPPYTLLRHSYTEVDDEGNCAHLPSGFVYNTTTLGYVSPAGFGGRRRRCTHFTYDNASDEFTQTQVTVGPHAAPPVELHPEQGILASPDADDSEASDD